MHTRIRAPGAGDLHGLVRDLGQRLFDPLLHAKTGALALPAVITGTVVFDSDGDTHAGHYRRVARKRRAERLTR